MEHQSIAAALLGLLEGLTEFIPVSSTAHLLLAAKAIGFESRNGVFEVLIQLGAILAILVVYFGRILKILVDFPTHGRTRRFVIGVLLAFLPAAILGAALHDFITTYLFKSPMLICITLIVGGVVLLVVDRAAPRPRYHDVMEFPLSLCLKIGLFQCLALIPGASRSGSTIVGALLMGADKRSAAEFSFFLAMPTMLGAFVLDFYKNRHGLTANDLSMIAIGFVAAFVVALVVVRYLLDYVSRYGYAVFGWWRIAVGAAGLAALMVWS